jgi:putative tricarboxylic transport membrane protein
MLIDANSNDTAFRRIRAVARPLLIVSAFATAVVISTAHAQAWKPDKPVEIIATNAPGGGADRIIRIMLNVMQERRDFAVPVSIVNKPGGGGAVSYAYLNQHAGDGHYVVLGGKALLTNNISGRGPSYTEMTPVAHLFGEYVCVTVRPDSPLKSGRDLIERIRKDPASLSFGLATSLGGPNHQGVAAALKSVGAEVKSLRNVIFPSGGAASTAMLGGHVDVVPISAAFGAALLRNGQVRLLAVGAPKRLGGILADVPTWREQGYDVVVSNWRVIVGPKGMTQGQIAFWEEVLKRFTESAEWKKELEANFWTSEFMNRAETMKFLERDHAAVKAFLTDLGLAK